jgi:hypothetical protein
MYNDVYNDVIVQETQILCPILVYYNVSTFVIVKYLHFGSIYASVNGVKEGIIGFISNWYEKKYGISGIQDLHSLCIRAMPYLKGSRFSP